MDYRLADLKFDEHGLIPAVVQHAVTHQVLTLAYMNNESLQRTIQTGQTWFWSRSRNELWHKGATSGNTQEVVELRLDCDHDAIVVLVNPTGPACHTGLDSCFHNGLEGQRSKAMDQGPLPGEDLGELLNGLYQLIENRQQVRPQGSYTSYLFDKGLDKILKKVGEESAETIIAAKNENPTALIAEVSDLLYHILVLLVDRGVSLEDIWSELARRRREVGAGGK
jgi:phosphoribosyl-ATP pyrophosphohydrolase/phosphoribosyl-AMP cyclohydrolase